MCHKNNWHTLIRRDDVISIYTFQVDLQELNPTQRIHHMERSMQFLRQQHQEVLKSLHEEIEGLKRENKGDLFVSGL